MDEPGADVFPAGRVDYELVALTLEGHFGKLHEAEMPFRPDGYGPQRYLRAMTSIVGHAQFLVLVAFEIYLLFYLLT